MAELVSFNMPGDESEYGVRPFGHLIDGKKYKDITKDGGVLKLLLDHGVDQVVPIDGIVFLHYIGYASNHLEPFEVTYLQGKPPKCFNLGNNELLSGLELGIQTMKQGEHARFLLGPKYAYREMGCPPRIPPNSTVLFDVHLVKYYANNDLPINYDPNNKDPDKFLINSIFIKILHFEGNKHFELKNIEDATRKYAEAIDIWLLTGCTENENATDMFKYLNILYSNLSICYLKQCAFNKVCRMGSEAMKYSKEFSKNNAKLWFNWGKALRLLKDFTGGKQKLEKALKLEPQNITIKKELLRFEHDRIIQDRIDAFSRLDVSTERLPSDFWDIFYTVLKEFIDSSDDVITVKLFGTPDDIKFAEFYSSMHGLKLQRLQYQGDNFFAIKKHTGKIQLELKLGNTITISHKNSQ